MIVAVKVVFVAVRVVVLVFRVVVIVRVVVSIRNGVCSQAIVVLEFRVGGYSQGDRSNS